MARMDPGNIGDELKLTWLVSQKWCKDAPFTQGALRIHANIHVHYIHIFIYYYLFKNNIYYVENIAHV